MSYYHQQTGAWDLAGLGQVFQQESLPPLASNDEITRQYLGPRHWWTAIRVSPAPSPSLLKLNLRIADVQDGGWPTRGLVMSYYEEIEAEAKAKAEVDAEADAGADTDADAETEAEAGVQMQAKGQQKAAGAGAKVRQDARGAFEAASAKRDDHPAKRATTAATAAVGTGSEAESTVEPTSSQQPATSSRPTRTTRTAPSRSTATDDNLPSSVQNNNTRNTWLLPPQVNYTDVDLSHPQAYYLQRAASLREGEFLTLTEIWSMLPMHGIGLDRAHLDMGVRPILYGALVPLTLTCSQERCEACETRGYQCIYRGSSNCLYCHLSKNKDGKCNGIAPVNDPVNYKPSLVLRIAFVKQAEEDNWIRPGSRDLWFDERGKKFFDIT